MYTKVERLSLATLCANGVGQTPQQPANTLSIILFHEIPCHKDAINRVKIYFPPQKPVAFEKKSNLEFGQLHCKRIECALCTHYVCNILSTLLASEEGGHLKSHLCAIVSRISGPNKTLMSSAVPEPGNVFKQLCPVPTESKPPICMSNFDQMPQSL